MAAFSCVVQFGAERRDVLLRARARPRLRRPPGAPARRPRRARPPRARAVPSPRAWSPAGRATSLRLPPEIRRPRRKTSPASVTTGHRDVTRDGSRRLERLGDPGLANGRLHDVGVRPARCARPTRGRAGPAAGAVRRRRGPAEPSPRRHEEPAASEVPRPHHARVRAGPRPRTRRGRTAAGRRGTLRPRARTRGRPRPRPPPPRRAPARSRASARMARAASP